MELENRKFTNYNIHTIDENSCVPKGMKIMTKKPKYPAVDEAVYQWLYSVRKLNGIAALSPFLGL